VPAGQWLTAQGGVAFSARPGTVDAAVLNGAGLTGEGVLATVTFKVLSAGDPKIRIKALDGRDAGNRKVAVAQSERAVVAAPTVTRLAFARPNPFRRPARPRAAPGSTAATPQRGGRPVEPGRGRWIRFCRSPPGLQGSRSGGRLPLDAIIGY
jgi:hypothetical protein